MIERGKTYVMFYVDTDDLIVVRCNEFPEAIDMTLPDFYQEYLSRDKLNVKDADYDFTFLVNFIKGAEFDNVATFNTYNEDASIRFTRYSRLENNIVCCAVFRQERAIHTNNENFSKEYLTGLLTRGAFTQIVTSKLNETRVNRSAVMLIDLDNFKVVNDTFGHATGDACLREMAKKISSKCPNEIIGRYGGDEFLVFVEEASKQKIHDLCSKLMSIEYTIPTRFSKPIRVTCSVGVAYIDDNLKELPSLFDMADKALYKAKNIEKNCSCIYDSGLFFVQPKTDSKGKKGLDGVHRHSIFIERNQFLFKEELKFRRNLTIFISFVVAFTLVIMIAIVSEFFTNRVREKTTQEAASVMQDISNQVSQNIVSNIDGWKSQLQLSAEILEKTHNSMTINTEMSIKLKELESSSTFDKMAVVFDDASIGLSDGTTIDMSSNNLILDVIAGNNVIGTFEYQTDRYMMFASPYNCSHTVGSSKHIVGVIGMVDDEKFSNLVYSTIFGYSGQFAIIDKNGNSIIRSAEEVDGNKAPENFLDFFNKYTDNELYKKIEEDLTLDRTDLVVIDVMDKEYFTYYTNLSINDWKIIIMVPDNEILPTILLLFKEMSVLTYSLLAVISLMTIICVSIFTIFRNKNLSLIFTDPVTGNINEERFKIDTAKLIERTRGQYAIVYLDIMHFKYLNEILGNIVADKLLLEVYNQLLMLLNKNEIIARIFADRYVSLLEYDTIEKLNDRLNNISQTINEYFAKDAINVKLAFGVYLISGNKYDIAACIDRANEASKYAKNDYENNFITYFDEDMMLKNLEKIEIETEAEHGLAENQFEIYYQLKRDIKKNIWNGSEALVRWIHPSKGLISPTKFISIFENSGFIIKLDLYVFEKVCQDIRKMIDSNIPVQLTSFNLSRAHFIDENFLFEFEKIINKYDIPVNLLEFEITESMIFDDAQSIKSAIEKIHKLGCKCSIDDFGSGYSSLNVLKEFDFDTVKLDRVFFYGINGFDKRSKIIVQSLTELSHNLKKKVVAEGIETIEQVEFLKSINCDLVQGFYYSKPLPFKEYAKILTKVKK